MKKQAILQAYKTADYQTKELLKKEFAEYFELPSTGWLKWKDTCSVVFRTGKELGYGVDSNKEWVEYSGKNGGIYWNFDTSPQDWQPATREEVKEILITEAKRRGIWDCPIIGANGLKWAEWHGHYTEEFDFKYNQLFSKYGLIFDNGKWATPIEEKTNSTTFEIDGKTYLVTLIDKNDLPV